MNENIIRENNLTVGVYRTDWAEVREIVERSAREGWGHIVPSAKVRETGKPDPAKVSRWSGDVDATYLAVLNGFTPDPTGIEAPSFADVDRPKWAWTDDPEGEFDNTAYEMGETEYFRSRTKRENRIGVSFRVQLGFRGGVALNTLTEYGRFVGEAIAAVQSQGLDVECWIESEARGVIVGQDRTRILTQTSRFGEPTIMSEWGAFFCEGGHRHLMFTLRDSLSRIVPGVNASRIGGSMHKRWAVSWDAERREILFECKSEDGGAFPAEAMAKQLDEIRYQLRNG